MCVVIIGPGAWLHIDASKEHLLGDHHYICNPHHPRKRNAQNGFLSPPRQRINHRITHGTLLMCHTSLILWRRNKQNDETNWITQESHTKAHHHPQIN